MMTDNAAGIKLRFGGNVSMQMLSTQIYETEWLRELWDCVKDFARRCVLGLLPYAALFICYKNLTDIPTMAALAVFLTLYSGAMALCSIGEIKIAAYYRSGALTAKRLLGASLLAAAPIYLFWVLFSIIPIMSYEIWLITGFPIVLVSAFAFGSVAEYWGKRKPLFWLMQTAVYIVCFAVGNAAGKIIFM